MTSKTAIIGVIVLFGCLIATTFSQSMTSIEQSGSFVYYVGPAFSTKLEGVVMEILGADFTIEAKPIEKDFCIIVYLPTSTIQKQDCIIHIELADASVITGGTSRKIIVGTVQPEEHGAPQFMMKITDFGQYSGATNKPKIKLDLKVTLVHNGIHA